MNEELEKLIRALDDEMVCLHIGVFELGDDPKKAIAQIANWHYEHGRYDATHPQDPNTPIA